MAAFDIMPYNSALGQTDLIHFGQATGTGLLVGEPCRIASAGTLTEVSSATGDNVAGIVINGPVSATAGDSRNINPRTGAAWAANDLIGYVVAKPGQRFITRNVSSNGTSFIASGLAVGTLANIGDPVGLLLVSNVHGIHIGASEALSCARIVDVLDSNKQSIQITGNTGVSVVFEIIRSQFTSAVATS